VLKPEFSEKRNALALEMNKRGIGTSIYYPVALPLSTFYRTNKDISKTVSYLNADTLANSNIALGIGPHVSIEEMCFVGESLISVLEEIL
jgi:dTDP-4-amino-4,6-dideoxygalactose transaminase